jgi:hypothetical protein
MNNAEKPDTAQLRKLLADYEAKARANKNDYDVNLAYDALADAVMPALPGLLDEIERLTGLYDGMCYEFNKLSVSTHERIAELEAALDWIRLNTAQPAIERRARNAMNKEPKP